MATARAERAAEQRGGRAAGSWELWLLVQDVPSRSPPTPAVCLSGPNPPLEGLVLDIPLSRALRGPYPADW